MKSARPALPMSSMGRCSFWAGASANRASLSTCETPGPDLKAYGKLIRLEQVLVNLLQNALEVLSGRADGRIRIATTSTGDRVCLSVEDNGPGIEPEVAEGLFTPFNTSKPRGLGLGLVISKDIVAEFGGRLELTRTGDTGTHFTIQLRKAP